MVPDCLETATLNVANFWFEENHVKIVDKYDSLHTLNVWTIYGNMMVKLLELYYRERYPYTICYIWRSEHDHNTYKASEIVGSLVGGVADFLLRLTGGKYRNNMLMRGRVVSATPNAMDRSSWVLVLKGELDNQNGETIESTIVAYYDTDTGRGFCLVPDQQLTLIGR